MADLEFKVNEGIATITLNRPQVKNAFSLDMIRCWVKALEEVRDNEEIRVLVLTGAIDGGFCAGGDIKSMKEGKGFVHLNKENELDFTSSGLKRKNSLWKYVQRIPLLMEEIDKPTIAAINGDAIGAGLDMALQCDLRFASDKARFSESYINIGLVPGDGGAYYLPRLIGMDKALELLWTGRLFDAEEAHNLGVITYIVQNELLLDEVYKFAEKLVNGPQQAIRLIKRTVYQGLRTDLRTSLDTVSSFMGLVTDSQDFSEGIQAINEKRKPKFR